MKPRKKNKGRQFNNEQNMVIQMIAPTILRLISVCDMVQLSLHFRVRDMRKKKANDKRRKERIGDNEFR